MGARDLIAALGEAGVSLTLNGDRIEVRPASLLTEEMRASLRAAKPELLVLLAKPQTPTDRSPEPVHLPADVAMARAAMHRLGYADADAEAQLQAALADVPAAVAAADLRELADERDGVMPDEAATRERRVILLVNSGMPRAEAGELAHRLMLRDRDGDDRRMCVECARLRFVSAGRRAAVRFCGHPSNRVTFGFTRVDMLFRCDGFLGELETR